MRMPKPGSRGSKVTIDSIFFNSFQSYASISRRCAALANCAFQVLPSLIPPLDPDDENQPTVSLLSLLGLPYQ